jgi:hypothetical protein
MVFVVTSPRAYFRAVVNGFVLRKVRAYLGVKAAFVGMQAALFVDVGVHDPGDRRAIGNGDMERADVTGALDKSNDRTVILDLAVPLGKARHGAACLRRAALSYRNRSHRPQRFCPHHQAAQGHLHALPHASDASKTSSICS